MYRLHKSEKKSDACTSNLVLYTQVVCVYSIEWCSTTKKDRPNRTKNRPNLERLERLELFELLRRAIVKTNKTKNETNKLDSSFFWWTSCEEFCMKMKLKIPVNRILLIKNTKKKINIFLFFFCK